MKHLSTWASHHPIQARLFIVLAKCLLVPAGLVLGILSFAKNGPMPASVLYVLSAAFGACWLFYPKKGIRRGMLRHSYVRQKGVDMAIGVLAFGIAIFGGNRYGDFIWTEEVPAPPTLTCAGRPDATAYASLENRGPDDWKQKIKEKSFRKKIRAQVRNEIRAAKAAGDLDGGQVALIILTIVAALGLMYLVAALACGIACNGSDALAVLAAVAGGGLVIFLAFLAIRGIVRSGRSTE